MRRDGRYGRVLRRPGTGATLGPYVAARLASSMLLLALLLLVQQRTGSFFAAGVVTGFFAASVAVCAPLLGRLADARGHRVVLVGCGLLHPLTLVVVERSLHASLEALVVPAAVLAGATMPPMAACMRALWSTLVPEEDLRPTAFAVESMVVELCELGGPLLVGLLVVLVSPGAAVLASAAASGVGALLFAASRASRSRPGERRLEPQPDSALSLPGVSRLIALVGVSVAAVAVLEVSVARFAHDAGAPALAGWLIGAWVAGSLVGGWFYGARHWAVPLPLQLAGLLAAGAVLGLAPLLADGPVEMAVLLALSGLCLAPSTAAQFAVLSALAPDRRRTESFTWASTAAFLGIGAGNLLAGPVVQQYGWRAGTLLAAVVSGVAAGLAWRSRAAFGLAPAAPALVPAQPTPSTVELERRLAETLSALHAAESRAAALTAELSAALDRHGAVRGASVRRLRA